MGVGVSNQFEFDSNGENSFREEKHDCDDNFCRMHEQSSCDEIETIKRKLHKYRLVLLSILIVFFGFGIFFIG